MSRYPSIILFLLLIFVCSSIYVRRVEAADAAPRELDCRALPCSEVLPGATRFERVGKSRYRAGFDAEGNQLGWVVLSTDVVDVKAYSGKPLVTLVGLSQTGVISGAKVVHHSEPILLVGIPEAALTNFVAFYRGKPAISKIVVGSSDDPNALSVDIISGATVTALAQNKTILETARKLGTGVGVVKGATLVPGHFVKNEAPWTWQQMVAEGALGRLTVSEAAMGVPSPSGAFIDIYFAIADAPQVGISLLGPEEYAWNMKELKAGEHLLVLLGNGSSSFKGSGFVRGGIFDRVRVEQGLASILFTDKDYKPLSGASTADAPEFKEGAVFVTRDGKLDPGAPFDLVFVGSRYNQKGGFDRDFKATTSTFRAPKSVYVLDGPDPNQEIWRAAWRSSGIKKYVVAGFLLVVVGLFLGRKRLTRNTKQLKWIHISVMTASFLGLGVVLHAQPSVTQVLTVVGSVVGEWRWELFLSEPLVFMLWIFTRPRYRHVGSGGFLRMGLPLWRTYGATVQARRGVKAEAIRAANRCAPSPALPSLCNAGRAGRRLLVQCRARRSHGGG